MSTPATVRRKDVLVAFLILFAGVGWNVRDAANSRNAIVNSGRVVAVEGCNRDFNTVLASRKIVEGAQDRFLDAYDAGVITKEQLHNYTADNQRQVARLVVPDCRKVPALLTDDPRNTHYPPPYPKFLGTAK